MYIQWVLLRRGSAYAPALRDAGLTSLLQQEAGLRGEKSEKSPGDWLARFFSTWVRGGRSCQGALKERSLLFGFHSCP